MKYDFDKKFLLVEEDYESNDRDIEAALIGVMDDEGEWIRSEEQVDRLST